MKGCCLSGLRGLERHRGTNQGHLRGFERDLPNNSESWKGELQLQHNICREVRRVVRVHAEGSGSNWRVLITLEIGRARGGPKLPAQGC